MSSFSPFEDRAEVLVVGPESHMGLSGAASLVCVVPGVCSAVSSRR